MKCLVIIRNTPDIDIAYLLKGSNCEKRVGYNYDKSNIDKILKKF